MNEQLRVEYDDRPDEVVASVNALLEFYHLKFEWDKAEEDGVMHYNLVSSY